MTRRRVARLCGGEGRSAGPVTSGQWMGVARGRELGREKRGGIAGTRRGWHPPRGCLGGGGKHTSVPAQRGRVALAPSERGLQTRLSSRL